MLTGEDAAGPGSSAPRPSSAQRRRELDEMDTRALRQSVNWFSLLSGTANVIMQLSLRPVAYGVMDSRVTEGSLFANPRRRTRTTMGYLAVTMLGGAQERAAYRRATNRSHARVRSAPGDEVAYRAFDPALQKWVAACLYTGAEKAYEALHGRLRGEFRGRFYREGMVFGTTLQLPPEDWPATRDEFGAYWDQALAHLEIDERTRDYLMRIVRLEHLGWRIPAPVMRVRVRTVAGHLGPRFRQLMGMSWTADDQRAFDRANRRLAVLQRVSPAWLRELPLRRALHDVRRRLAAGVELF